VKVENSISHPLSMEILKESTCYGPCWEEIAAGSWRRSNGEVDSVDTITGFL